ncbi:prephenate dehydrogenase/arogenate dehydrogenase family protein [Salinigranum sp.]|uniref:prephenate dehydrogenase/arogenate dehydrogenase family protein n=1 Tax=Salinigranum sp. TaxID=1966351 RepID=UPI003569A2D0
MRLLVVGAGSMGRWFADTVGEHTGDADVAFADADPTAAADAAAALDARHVPVDGDERYDVVCVAVPISAVEASIDQQARRAREGIVDVSGVMAAPVGAMRRALPDGERVSLHPLFAPSNAPGTVASVVDAPGPATDRIRAALEAAGNTVFETTPDEHDRAMETVQSSAHAAVLAYALAAGDVRPEFHTPVSAALEEAVEMVTGGKPRVYREIQETFEGAERVAEAAARVAAADGDAFDELYREASAPNGDGGTRDVDDDTGPGDTSPDDGWGAER